MCYEMYQIPNSQWGRSNRIFKFWSAEWGRGKIRFGLFWPDTLTPWWFGPQFHLWNYGVLPLPFPNCSPFNTWFHPIYPYLHPFTPLFSTLISPFTPFSVNGRANCWIQRSFLPIRQGWWWNYYYKRVGNCNEITWSKSNWSWTSRYD